MRLLTDYEVGDIPHGEHPLPQCRRENWACLNGIWDFKKEDKTGIPVYEGNILVPFSPETIRSGAPDGFVLNSGEKLVYKRSFIIDKNLILGKTLLHFGAVDSECWVWINGEKVGGHSGGFTAFALDITPFINEGENEIVVECEDEGTRNSDARGKQNDKRGGIWYTPQSGIWQTVWLESMPKAHINGLKITPDALNKKVRIRSHGGGKQTITVYDNGVQMLCATYEEEIDLYEDFQLWSPENPKLYDFKIENEEGDCVYSYFGLRSFGIREGSPARLTLNGKPYFFNGVLDQGYWSDGMLTYPSDQAAIDELQMLKDMGFNTLRKHIKLEPMRWYYHCDRLGIVVWQDFVNGGGEYNFHHIATFPFLGFKHRDDDYKYFARENEWGRDAFMRMSEEIIEQLYNCVCIGVWVPFNEGWGQFDSGKFTRWLKGKDDTRIIDSVSGWHDQGVGETELRSLHIYYTRLKVPKDSRPVVLSEFGGYSLQTERVFDPNKEFGYKKFKSKEELAVALEKLYLKKILPLIGKGLCGCIYTQVSDVEEEINGFVTYDRKILKVPVEKMREINDKILEESKKIK